MEAKRGKGRPRKDEYDADGNLLPPKPRDIPEDEPDSPNVEAAATAPQDMKALLDQMRSELKDELRREMSALQPSKVEPKGTWDYDYRNQPHLRVMGGLEVDHPEFRDGTSLPLPPSRIPMYVAKGGGTTSHVKAPVKRYLKYDATGSNPLLDEDGQPMFTEVPIDKGAELDAQGRPILTDEYKFWLHVRARGGRLDGNAVSDISAGKGIPAGAIAAADVQFGDNGIPVTND